MSEATLYQQDIWRPYFARLRAENPVHWSENELWHQRKNNPPETMDLISQLATNPSTRAIVNDPLEYLDNLILLIVGGNDTTRNSTIGGALALNQHPNEDAKLTANPSRIPSVVSKIIRWQTLLMHMRRIATRDVELGGKTIRRGDKVVMRYLSGNHDETAIERPDEFIIDRKNPRYHLSVGSGIHRCMGNRLGKMQLRILWEEILKRLSHSRGGGRPTRASAVELRPRILLAAGGNARLIDGTQ